MSRLIIFLPGLWLFHREIIEVNFDVNSCKHHGAKGGPRCILCSFQVSVTKPLLPLYNYPTWIRYQS